MREAKSGGLIFLPRPNTRSAARGEMARKVHDSYAASRDRTAAWSRVSIRAVLEACFQFLEIVL